MYNLYPPNKEPRFKQEGATYGCVMNAYCYAYSNGQWFQYLEEPFSKMKWPTWIKVPAKSIPREIMAMNILMG